MIDKIKKNKLTIIFFTILFIVLVYCSFQIFIISDDLPYSLLHRGSERVASIKDIISNQLADYKYTNARIFLHSIVQFLLIFGKNLWAVLNPLMIILSIILLSYITYLIQKKKTLNKKYIILFFTSCFLMLYDYKYLIYWVAGSVNYVWVFNLILLFIIYDLKVGLITKKISLLICLIGSVLHESFAIFIIIYLITSIFLSKFIIKDANKNYKKYSYYLILSILGLLFLMLSPSTITRMNSSPIWNNMNILDKLLVAIPSISKSSFYLYDIYNLIPIIFILSIIYNLYKNKFNGSSILLVILLILSLTLLFINNGWICFILALIVCITQIIILYQKQDYKLICILISAYAIIYSMSLTIEYIDLRTNYYFNLILSIFILYNYLNCKTTNIISKILKILLVIITFILISIEIHIYSYIGNINQNRINTINKVKENNINLIEFKKIKEPYGKFHIDANEPSSKEYWAYEYFLNYYQLNKNVDIVLKP